MINTAVIPAAGSGTRLLTVTKETPKEMVPLFSNVNGVMVTRPLVERIFLQLFDAGIRNFYIIVGKNKRAIEDHFTPDLNYQNTLTGKNNEIFKYMIKDFYRKVEQSHIIWINQNTPKGFGAAVLHARQAVGDKPFLVHAGDAFIRGHSDHVLRLIQAYEKYQSSVTLYLREIVNPKAYGVAEAKRIDKNTFQVLRVEEKPKQPKSNFALMPLYIFESQIFDALSKIKPGLRNELQLTDGIQKMIEWNCEVRAIKFQRADDCIDVGTPENYFRSLQISFKDSKKAKN